MNSKQKQQLILASASPRRLELLQQIHIKPDEIISPDIDETPPKGMKAENLAEYLSLKKARFIAKNHPNHYVLAADTVVTCGQTVMDKTESDVTARSYLTKLSGRRHNVYGGITLITPAGRVLSKTSLTKVQFKTLSEHEINNYIAINEWQGKAGAYAIQGYAGCFIKKIMGSYSNVVGLSLYDTMNILRSAGYNPSQQR